MSARSAAETAAQVTVPIPVSISGMVRTLCLSTVFVSSLAFAQPESYYQDQWCMTQGDAEVVLPDRTRVDCLTDEYAVEVDFSYKWAEAIGQSLYYAEMTYRKPAVLLIVEPNDHRFLVRFHNATDGLDIRLFTIEK